VAKNGEPSGSNLSVFLTESERLKPPGNKKIDVSDPPEER
jgi:hypothetical protein